MREIIVFCCVGILFIAGCGDKDVVYVDSKTGKVIPPKQQLQSFDQEVACNEFGMTYYQTCVCGGCVYAPVLDNNSRYGTMCRLHALKN